MKPKMAKNSCTLNLQDFIPYPVQVLPLREFLPRDNQIINNPNYSTKYNGRCPFDCCQKQFQNQYFPNCELTNAPLRMKIGSADRHNKSSGIPCLERRTIYEGRVTEMPMRYEDLITDNPNSISITTANSNPISNLSSSSTSSTISSILNNREAASVDAQTERLKLTFHKGVVVGGNKTLTSPPNIDKPLQQQQDKPYNNNNNNSNSNINNKEQYKYFWDAERSSWTIETVDAQINSNRPIDPRGNSGGNNINETIQQGEQQWKQQQQYYNNNNNSQETQAQKDLKMCWTQSQLKSQATQQLIDHQNRQAAIQAAAAQRSAEAQGQRSAESQGQRLSSPDSNKKQPENVNNDFIDQQLNNHLKSFKYIKPPSSPTTGLAINMSGSPPGIGIGVGNYRGLNPQSRQIFKTKNQESNMKRALSPRAALEQYEKLRKYWDYQHQLLGSSSTAVPYQNQNQVQQHQQQQHLNYAAAHQPGISSGYNNSYPQYGNHWTPSASATVTANVGGHQQQFQPAGPCTITGGWNANLGYNSTHRLADNQLVLPIQNAAQRTLRVDDMSLSLLTSSNDNKNPTKGFLLKIKPRPQILEEDSRNLEPKSKDMTFSISTNRIIMNKSTATNIKEAINPNSKVPNNATNTTVVPVAPPVSPMEMEDDDAPKDLSLTGRRNSDQGNLLSASPPGRERAYSTGAIHGYDHIVHLDKRVKSYMCKRCFETLKSEQEIRNHLFCKMLNNTVQCHICRNLFSTEEYTEHLKLHAVKN